MRVLVTGSSGFIGRHVIHALLQAGYEVRALARRSATNVRQENIEHVTANLVEDDLERAVAGIDAVVHLAAQMHGSADQQWTSIVIGTGRLLEAMDGANVRRLVLCSSISVFDWRMIRRTVHEHSPLLDEIGADRASGYARAKLAQERLVRRWAALGAGELTVLRPGAVWGQDRLPAYEVGLALGPLLVVINPFRPVKLIYVENCAAAIAATLGNPRTIGETINLFDSDRVTAWQFGSVISKRWNKVPIPGSYWACRLVASLALGVARAVGRGRIRLPVTLTSLEFMARYRRVGCSNDKMKRLLGWQAPFTFPRAIARSETWINDGTETPD
jgi:nucleoside-diphosphate-sugar epimerase